MEADQNKYLRRIVALHPPLQLVSEIVTFCDQFSKAVESSDARKTEVVTICEKLKEVSETGKGMTSNSIRSWPTLSQH
jgi:hypothetical protein